MDQLVGGLVEPFAKRWGSGVVGASLVFWVAGFLLYALGRSPSWIGCAGDDVASMLSCRLADYGAVGAAVGFVLLAAVVVGASLAVAAVSPRAVWLLAGEGWPSSGPFGALTRWRLGRHQRRRGELARIDPSDDGSPSSVVAQVVRERSEAAVRARLRRYPGGAVMAPTRIGNAVAALGQRIEDRYGLAITVVWEPLLAVLPDHVQGRLAEQSRAVMGRAQGVVWSVAALVWVPLNTSVLVAIAWAAASVALARLTYALLADSVLFYCDLIEGAVSTHRILLYRAVGFAPPTSTATEPASGSALSAFLHDGAQVPVPLTWDARLESS